MRKWKGISYPIKWMEKYNLKNLKWSRIRTLSKSQTLTDLKTHFRNILKYTSFIHFEGILYVYCFADLCNISKQCMLYFFMII